MCTLLNLNLQLAKTSVRAVKLEGMPEDSRARFRQLPVKRQRGNGISEIRT